MNPHTLCVDYAVPLMTRAAGVTAVDIGRRTFEVTWTTGAPIQRSDLWSGETWTEELAVSAGAIRMGRLKSGAAPFMSEHSRGIGVVESAWLSGGEGRALVRFPKAGIDQEADRVFALIQDGIRKNVSVGYRVHKFEQSRDGKNRLVRRAVDWEPFEISSVTIAADPDARVRSAWHGAVMGEASKARQRMQARAALAGLATVPGVSAARLRMRLRATLAQMS